MEKIETVEIRIPKEFKELCASYKVTPVKALEAFIADVSQIMNYISEPREDGFSSNGSDERMFVAQYFERTWEGRN